VRTSYLALVAMFLMTSVGCTSEPATGADPGTVLDLRELFAADTVAGGTKTEGGGSFVAHFRVVRNGFARDAMVLEAPVSIRAPLAGAAPGAILECQSTPVFNVGDGMQMDMHLIDGVKRRVIYSRYYDAGRHLEDRAWIPLSIPLDLEGSSVAAQLEIRVSGGPQGDLVADWLALSDVRIIQGRARK
jgi:hypothetical protein